MNIEHFRMQRPTGHGFFHAASIVLDKHLVFRYVYDCGSKSRHLMERQVEDYCDNDIHSPFGSVSKLDALFISHFDSDHVNGLAHLMDRLTEVSHVFLPFLSDEEKILVLAEHVTTGHNFLPDPQMVSFLFRTEDWLKNRVAKVRSIHFVRETSDDPQTADRRDRGRVEGEVNMSDAEGHPIDGNLGHNVTIFLDIEDGLFWKFKTYVAKNNNILIKFKDAVSEEFEFGADKLAKEIDPDPHKWLIAGDNLKKMRRCYKRLSNEQINYCSLCLYSGCKDSYKLKCYRSFHDTRHYCIGFCRDSCLKLHTVLQRLCDKIEWRGWLGTGDCDLQTESDFIKFKEHFKDELDSSITITVPHHGAVKNFNSQLTGYGKHFVITSNGGAQPHHPSPAVVSEILRSGRYPVLVTKDNLSTFTEYMSFS